jgi:hypothetical protein
MHPHLEWTRSLKEGDSLYLVHRWGQSAPRQSRVTKIGSKWLYLTLGMRMDRRTGVIENNSSWEVFQDADAYERHRQMCSAWHKLRLFFDKPYPAGMTMGRIQQIADLVGVEIQAKPESAPKKS